MSNKKKLFFIIGLFGPLVLLSYALSAWYNTGSNDKLWGNIPESLISVYFLFMILATTSFFVFTPFILKLDDKRIGQFLGPYFLIIFPSILWMPLTVAYLNAESSMLWIIIRIVLFTVGIGSLILTWRIITSSVKRNAFYYAAIVSSILFLIQTLILDGLIWPYYFH